MSKEVMSYGIGADISKDWFNACVRSKMFDGRMKIVAQKKFKNNLKGHELFKEWMDKNRKNKDVPYQILMEVTGVYHENLLYYLYDHGYYVCLELARRVKKYLEIIGHKSKNDKIDGQGIAQMALERKFKKWKPISKEINELRSLFRHRKALIQSKNQFENQLHAIKHSAIKSLQVTNSLTKMINELKKQIARMEDEAIKLANTDSIFIEKVNQIVNSVKGLGMISVLTVLSETNGFESFRSSKQLESYAGFDVVENSSGNFTGKSRISKKGNAHIRANMYMPALSVIRSKLVPFYNLYLRILKRNGGIKKKAIVAVQRKLLILIYTLWKKNEPFDLKYYPMACEKIV